MKKRSYAVIGLGKFGYTVALTLAEANCDVMVVDKDPEIVQEMSDRVAYGVSGRGKYGCGCDRYR